MRGIVGINPEERRAKQDVVINLELTVDTRAAAMSDDIAQAVNYRNVCKRVIEHVEGAAPLLVERLAGDIARLVLAEFAVVRVRVRVEKPGALRSPARWAWRSNAPPVRMAEAERPAMPPARQQPGAVTLIIGLGSNVAPERHLPEAVRLLGDRAEIVSVSSAWATAR